MKNIIWNALFKKIVARNILKNIIEENTQVSIIFEKKSDINLSTKSKQLVWFDSASFLKIPKNWAKPNQWRYYRFEYFFGQKSIQPESIIPLTTTIDAQIKKLNLESNI